MAISKEESEFYYAGLPSNPLLVYRTSSIPWKPPTGPEAYRVLKELRPVFDHDITSVWNTVGPQICSHLDSASVFWTSIDIVRFAVGKEVPGPPVLWIGVQPETLTWEQAHSAAVECQKYLRSHKITDVEIEIRESVFHRSTGPKLLSSVFSGNVTAGLRGPLTPTLGLPIAAQATSYAEGTGGLYISNGNNIYILSARHVVFPLSTKDNKLYNYTNVSQPQHEVLLPGPRAFENLLESTRSKIWGADVMKNYYRQQLNELKDNGLERERIEGALKENEEETKALDKFQKETTKYWSEEAQRIIGHIFYSPPITVGTHPEGYTEDWALIQLDQSKIDQSNFKGNVIDLGTDISVRDFMSLMYPDPTAPTSFKYPSNRLLQLQGIIKKDELHNPHMRDENNERCIIVIKNGRTSGVTVGRATGIFSYVRQYFENNVKETSMEWAILPYNKKSGQFSTGGDSGAVIVDGKGRIGGLLTGGTGRFTESSDITYATPFYWLLQRIQSRFPNAHLYQTPQD